MKFKVLIADLKFGDLVAKRYVKGELIEATTAREIGKAQLLTRTRPPALAVAVDPRPVRQVASTRALKAEVRAEPVPEPVQPAPEPAPEAAEAAPAAAVSTPRGLYSTRRLKADDEG